MSVKAEDVVRRYLYDLLKSGGRVGSKTELAKAMNTSRNQLNIALKSGSLNANQVNGLADRFGGVSAIYGELETIAERMQRGALPPQLTAIEEEALQGRADRIRFSADRPASVDEVPASADVEPSLPSKRPRSTHEQNPKNQR